VAPREPFFLPEPSPDMLPPGRDDPEHEAAYFAPERWDAETSAARAADARDPVEHDVGRLDSSAPAAVFFSDFHMADGCAGGDDFLDSHLRRDEELGLQVGSHPPGQSRARLFASALTFALGRLRRRAGVRARPDVVLVEDVVNSLELKGRGGTLVSHRHRDFYRALDAAGKRAEVHWLRGNHDYVVPTGPWRRGEFYANPRLEVLAEHGDVFDQENWPPGPANKGSRMLLEAGSAFEVLPLVCEDGQLKYLMSGLDNLRPWSDDGVEAFLDHRAKFSDVAAMAAVLARVKFVGAADDSAAYRGALRRREGKYRGWLMVQGHTHVPAFEAGAYYNLGAWIASLVAPAGEERQVEAFPFLLVYRGGAGRRVEEYYTAGQQDLKQPASATLHTEDSVNALRGEYGYGELKA
jgi:hypothetical protein